MALLALSTAEVVRAGGDLTIVTYGTMVHVSEAAARLQRQGLIRYARGHIEVLDRPGLAHSTCECYGVIKTEYDRLLPMQQAV